MSSLCPFLPHISPDLRLTCMHVKSSKPSKARLQAEHCLLNDRKFVSGLLHTKFVQKTKCWKKMCHAAWEHHTSCLNEDLTELAILQAQRFLALVLLPHVRQDIEENKRCHFALFQAMRKATYKPDAFFKVPPPLPHVRLLTHMDLCCLMLLASIKGSQFTFSHKLCVRCSQALLFRPCECKCTCLNQQLCKLRTETQMRPAA